MEGEVKKNYLDTASVDGLEPAVFEGGKRKDKQ